MKTETLLILAGFAVVAFFLYRESAKPAGTMTGAQQAGGRQVAGPQDVFSSILNAATSIFNVATRPAQTTAANQ